MASRKPALRGNTSSVIGAGAAGGGIGTVIAAMANGLPQTSPWKPILVILAPIVAVFLSGLGLFIKAVYIDPFVNGRKQKAADAAMDAILQAAQKHADRVVSDPHASDAHRREVRQMVEELERLKIRKITKRMEVVMLEQA